MTVSAHRKDTIRLVSGHTPRVALTASSIAGHVTALAVGGNCLGVERAKRACGYRWRGLHVLAAGSGPPNRDPLSAHAHGGLSAQCCVEMPQNDEVFECKLMCCHVHQVGGAVLHVTERWHCLQRVVWGLRGTVLVLLVLEVCVAITASVFSVKAIRFHRTSTQLTVCHALDAGLQPSDELGRFFYGIIGLSTVPVGPLKTSKVKVCCRLTPR